MGKTLILIDGHALAFRQYYALERSQMRTSDGTPTWAVYGFFKSIFDLLKNKDIKADAIAVAFDVSHVTFRTEKYSDYKSNRSAMPDDMQIQMGLIYKGLKAFNIPIYTKEGYEADDVIGTISKRSCELGHKTFILTGDQDAFQLVDKDGCIKVILPSKGELTEYNWDKIYEKLGVYPNQVIDYKGLRGDASDCIPGIKGIGEKTAQKLLAKYGTLDNVLENCENIQEKSLKEKICQGKEIAKLSQELATIIRDLDIDFDFDGTKVELPNINKVTEFLKEMQFYTFIKNINSILASFDKDTQATMPTTSFSHTEQLGLFAQAVTEEINKNSELVFSSELITDNQKFDELVNKLNTENLFAFKVFADMKNAVNVKVFGIGFAVNKDLSAENDIIVNSNKSSNSSTYYIPLAHSNLQNQLKSDDVFAKLKPIFENQQIKKFTYDAKNQYNILRNNGIETKSIIFDILLASYVKNPNVNHNLDIQAIENISHAIIPFGETEGKNKISFENAVFENAFKNACDEMASIIELTKFWIENSDKQELKIIYDIETPLSIVLADMEYTGVSIDKDYLISLTEIMDKNLKDIEAKIYEISGYPFNINSPKQVSKVLFEDLCLKSKKKTAKKAMSTSAAVLEELAQEYEIAREILEYRKYAKLKSTYTEALPELTDKKDGRIHTTYNQTVTTTGRLSSSNPNLQNIPARTTEGNQIRNAFVPKDRENSLILSADYSQIELRLLAHISKDKNLCDAFKSGIDVHTLTASKVFDVPVEEVTKEMRYRAKAVNFGIVYGQSKYGLAKSLNITNADAENFINKYFMTYPNIKLYMENTIAKVEQTGFVETVFGRKRDLRTELSSSNNMIREFAKRAAINQPIQGTAADLMKIAMIDFYKKLKENNLKSKMIMQVHDEIVVELCKDETEIVKNLVKEAMELNQPLDVPLVVDINIGETWKE